MLLVRGVLGGFLFRHSQTPATQQQSDIRLPNSVCNAWEDLFTGMGDQADERGTARGD